MPTLQRLLAATDLSAPARHAADRAAMLARQTKASLDLVHVASLAPLEKLRRLVNAVPATLEQQLLDTASDAVHELAAALSQHHGVTVRAHVASGAVLPELGQQAAMQAADLIVLGARGASFMRHILLGSTAERMVSSAKRPMLVVKQATHERYRTVLVPVDFSASSLPAVQLAQAVAPDAVIVLLHVFEIPFEGKLKYAGVDDDTIDYYRVAARQDALLRLQELCDVAGLDSSRARCLALHGSPLLQIMEQEQEQDCDLIVMGKHGESVLEDLLLGSVTKHVLTESQCDVLVSVDTTPTA